jgi:hypothetical protein
VGIAIVIISLLLIIILQAIQKNNKIAEFRKQAIENGAAHWVIIDNEGNTAFEWIKK